MSSDSGDSDRKAAQNEPAGVRALKTNIFDAVAANVDSARLFACFGKVNGSANPGLNIDDLGLVGLPLSTRELQAIITRCHQSPFGKGEETLVDESVRRTWELDATQFRFTHPEWPTTLDGILSQVHHELGLTFLRSHLHAEPYKLLIYESGAFFKRHQDSEKIPGMFGTLVVCLPSEHKGGQVFLSHHKRKVCYDSSKHSTFDTTFAAWYSDVFHEIQEVSFGYRVVLTFNLIQKSLTLSQKPPDEDNMTRLTRALNDWEHAQHKGPFNLPPYLIYPLEHQYSKVSLSIDTTKGSDAARLRVLNDACRASKWDDNGFDKADWEREEGFYEIVTPDGNGTGLKPDWDPSCYLSEYDFDDEDYDESEHEGYTGNAGASTTLWYRKSVILLVPPSRMVEFGLTPRQRDDAVLDKLEALALRANANPAAKEELHAICNIVLEREETTGEILSLSLNHDWLDLYDRVPFSHKLSSEGLAAVAQYMHQNGADRIASSIDKVLSAVANISRQSDMVSIIAKDSNGQKSADTPRATIDNFDRWYHSVIKQILLTKERSGPDDAIALAMIVKTSGVDVVAEMLLKMDSVATNTIMGFLLELVKNNPDLSNPSHQRLIEATLDKLWSGFAFFAPMTDYSGTTRVSYIDLNDLPSLLAMTADHCNNGKSDTDEEKHRKSQLKLSAAVEHLAKAARNVDETFSRDYLLLFVENIIFHRIPVLIVEATDIMNIELFDAISRLILSVTTTAIRHLGLEPVQPTNWYRPAKGCGCFHCQAVDAFLRNPNAQEFFYDCETSTKRHLTHQFTHRWPVPRYDWICGHDARAKPPRWKCTKRNFAWEEQHKSWVQRRHMLQGRLAQMNQGDRGILKAWLGEHFGAIMECRVELLSVLEQKEGITEQNGKVLGELSPSGVNTRSSRKRMCEGECLIDHAKRRQLDASLPETIDLT